MPSHNLWWRGGNVDVVAVLQPLSGFAWGSLRASALLGRLLPHFELKMLLSATKCGKTPLFKPRLLLSATSHQTRLPGVPRQTSAEVVLQFNAQPLVVPADSPPVVRAGSALEARRREDASGTVFEEAMCGVTVQVKAHYPRGVSNSSINEW